MKLRSINTRFWEDPYVEDLPPLGKLLFIYLISNDKTNIAGVYEISIKTISYETGIKPEEVQKLLKKFQSDSKMIYVHQYVVLFNSPKHHAVDKSLSLKKNITNTLDKLPEKIKVVVASSQYAMLDELMPDDFMNYQHKPMFAEDTQHEVTESDIKTVEEKPVSKPSSKRTKAVPVADSPPTEEEVVKFFVEKGYTSESGKKAYEYYHEANWKDSKGNPVMSWKQKAISVWFKDENKIGNHVAGAKPLMASIGSNTRQDELAGKMGKLMSINEDNLTP